MGVLETEDLSDLVLVGHRYGGMVITGVAEHCADRIGRLVSVDEFVPEDGQSCWDNPHSKEYWEKRARASGLERLCLPPAIPVAPTVPVAMAPRRRSHPIRPGGRLEHRNPEAAHRESDSDD